MIIYVVMLALVTEFVLLRQTMQLTVMTMAAVVVVVVVVVRSTKEAADRFSCYFAPPKEEAEVEI